MNNRIIIAAACAALIASSCRDNSGIYDIRDFGAEPGSAELSTVPIQKAVDRCGADGGGTVVIPRGDWTVGTINLRTNVELHLSKGARLVASTDLSA